MHFGIATGSDLYPQRGLYAADDGLWLITEHSQWTESHPLFIEVCLRYSQLTSRHRYTHAGEAIGELGQHNCAGLQKIDCRRGCAEAGLMGGLSPVNDCFK
jgi:hypothetical protein